MAGPPPKRQKLTQEELREFLDGAAPSLQPELARRAGEAEVGAGGRHWAAPISHMAQLAGALDGGRAATDLRAVAARLEPWLPPLGSLPRCCNRDCLRVMFFGGIWSDAPSSTSSDGEDGAEGEEVAWDADEADEHEAWGGMDPADRRRVWQIYRRSRELQAQAGRVHEAAVAQPVAKKLKVERGFEQHAQSLSRAGRPAEGTLVEGKALTPTQLATNYCEDSAVWLAQVDVHGPGKPMCRGSKKTANSALCVVLGRDKSWLYGGQPPRAARLGIMKRRAIGAVNSSSTTTQVKLSPCACGRGCLWQFAVAELAELQRRYSGCKTRADEREVLHFVASHHGDCCDDAIRQAVGGGPGVELVRVSRDRNLWEEDDYEHGNKGRTPVNFIGGDRFLAVRETLELYTYCDPGPELGRKRRQKEGKADRRYRNEEVNSIDKLFDKHLELNPEEAKQGGMDRKTFERKVLLLCELEGTDLCAHRKDHNLCRHCKQFQVDLDNYGDLAHREKLEVAEKKTFPSREAWLANGKKWLTDEEREYYDEALPDGSTTRREYYDGMYRRLFLRQKDRYARHLQRDFTMRFCFNRMSRIGVQLAKQLPWAVNTSEAEAMFEEEEVGGEQAPVSDAPTPRLFADSDSAADKQKKDGPVSEPARPKRALEEFTAKPLAEAEHKAIEPEMWACYMGDKGWRFAGEAQQMVLYYAPHPKKIELQMYKRLAAYVPLTLRHVSKEGTASAHVVNNGVASTLDWACCAAKAAKHYKPDLDRKLDNGMTVRSRIQGDDLISNPERIQRVNCVSRSSAKMPALAPLLRCLRRRA